MDLNAHNYKGAFQKTEHENWSDLKKFTEIFKYWTATKLIEFEGKSYYSQYNADTIVNLKYLGTETDSNVETYREYDFHLNKRDNSWKIIRLFEPRNIAIDALKKEEVPKSSIETVELFLNFLDQKLFQKAYLLIDYEGWGNKEEFLSNDGFGCVESVDIKNIKLSKIITDKLEIVRTNFYINDPCNRSRNYSNDFHMEKQDIWKIVDVR